MSEFKGTEDTVEIYRSQLSRGIIISSGLIFICEVDTFTFDGQYLEEETEANANLIVDAFKVRQQINCELSELLEQSNEMLAMLERLQVSFDWISKNCLLPIIKNQDDADLQIEHISYNIQEIEQLIKKVKDNE